MRTATRATITSEALIVATVRHCVVGWSQRARLHRFDYCPALVPSMPARHGNLLRRARAGGLAADTFWGLVLEFVAMASMMLTFLLLGRSLGADGYGPYVVLYSIVAPLVTLASSGITLALLEYVVRRQEDVATAVRSCITLSVVTGAGLMIVGGAVALLIVDGISPVAIGAVLLTEFVVNPLLAVGAAAVQAVETFARAARIRSSVFVGRALVVVVLASAGALTIKSLAIGALVASTVLVVYFWSRLLRSGLPLLPGRPRWRHARSSMLYSVAISAASLNNEGDKSVLGAYGFRQEVGQYGAAYRVVTLGMVPVASLINASHTRFLHHSGTGKRVHLDRAVRFTAVGGAYGLVIGAAIFLLAPLVPRILGSSFDGSTGMIRWLAPLVFLRAATMFPLNALMGLGRTGLRTTVVVANALLAIVLYLALIPRWSWHGAIAGTLISETLEMVSIWAALIWSQSRAGEPATNVAISGEEP